jgi:hypothetical protein
MFGYYVAISDEQIAISPANSPIVYIWDIIDGVPANKSILSVGTDVRSLKLSNGTLVVTRYPTILALYEKVDGVWTQKGYLPNGYYYDFFDNKLVVGIQDDDNNKGAAYIYEFINGSLTLTTRIIASDRDNGNVNENFGHLLSMNQNMAVISSRSGIYLFELVDGSWTERVKISTDNINDSFTDLSISDSGQYIIFKGSYSTWIYKNPIFDN